MYRLCPSLWKTFDRPDNVVTPWGFNNGVEEINMPQFPMARSYCPDTFARSWSSFHFLTRGLAPT